MERPELMAYVEEPVAEPDPRLEQQAECYGSSGKDITCATCVVLVLLPHLHEHLLPSLASEIRHVNRPLLWPYIR
jgi:hypothetical protein